MHSHALDIDWLNSSADRIEEILARKSLPAQVDGGDILASSVRFHLMPLMGMKAEHVEQAVPEIARAVGVSEVWVSDEPDGIALEVSLQQDRSLRLLPLLAALEEYEPLTAIVGMTDCGRPLSLNLKEEDSSHLWISGPGDTGKSELLRSLVASLALGNRPIHLKMLGIDVDGNDLTVIEALPHCLARLATNVRTAQETIFWLEKEVERRLHRGIQQPAIALFIEDMGWMDHKATRGLAGSFRHMISHAGRANVHVLAASRPVENPHLRRTFDAVKLTRVVPVTSSGAEFGLFDFHSATGGRQRAKIAVVGASDLQVVVARASACSSMDPHGLKSLYLERLQ